MTATTLTHPLTSPFYPHPETDTMGDPSAGARGLAVAIAMAAVVWGGVALIAWWLA